MLLAPPPLPQDLPPPARPAWLSVAALGLAMLMLAIAVHAYNQAVDARRAAVLHDEIRAVRQALEAYFTDHASQYPRPERVHAALRAYGVQRTALVQPAGARGWPRTLPDAHALNLGRARSVPPGTVLGRGHARGDGPDDALTYGALLYDLDPDAEAYVLYAVVRRGDDAVLLEMLSNMGC